MDTPLCTMYINFVCSMSIIDSKVNRVVLVASSDFNEFPYVTSSNI